MKKARLNELLTAFVTLLYLRAVNFHTVSKGVLYRSAQLNLDRLSRYVETHSIKSIVNLRGPQAGRRWYRREKEFSLSKGIVHADFDLSAIRKIPVQELDRILEFMRNAPKPILIHCYAGADRTGLIAALWRLAEDRDAPLQALNRQLCWMKGHFSTLHIGTNAMVRSFWDYVKHIQGDGPLRGRPLAD
ncbi:protein tyrosine/serine phosphatase [Dethiosulfovibrio peptidovorans DSM 11002]|uniref:Protein tyrosine/serine phosphatase n=1 Tax=Dethiosulfovibrio peptidovorans DSM 11002 TaxID=469381 RepID=D2Z6U6_9BACT|nr:tyrosine-protein phosphatase [Dethiosulfovibrio peptidovorans]EFC91193.1 protein tyrosine/serine phosphatase [Dethiosulfovibrio peptidovorans DSM 11002]